MRLRRSTCLATLASLASLGSLAAFAAACGDDSGGAAPGTDAGSPQTTADTGSPNDGPASSEDTGAPTNGDAGSTGNTRDGAGADAAGNGSIWSSPTDGGGPAVTGPTTTGTVVVNPGKVVGNVQPRFVGLSFEKSHLTDSFFTKDNAPLIAMFNLLGPSLLRIGGNSVDATTWSPTAQPTDAAVLGTTIGTADVDGLAAFLNATGWKVIYAVGLKSSTPAAAAAEATYAATTLGPSLLGLEIGNEIDLYGLSQTQAFTNWEAAATAVHTAVPNAALTGPATAGVGYIPAFATSEASRISLLTQHYYRGDGESAASTMAALLTPDPNLSAMLKTMATAATANNIASGFRIDECNSYYNHGSSGVSNAFGSALWILDFLFTNALAGSTGVNLHGGGTGQDGARPFYYSPIEEADGVVTNAQPIFYGMLLFTIAGPGNLMATTTTVAQADGGALSFSAYAVAPGDGSTNVVLVNKDATSAVEASVQLGANVGTASALYLEASGLDALDGVTLASAGISPAGAWAPGKPVALPVSGEDVAVIVPAASAAIVHIQ